MTTSPGASFARSLRRAPSQSDTSSDHLNAGTGTECRRVLVGESCCERDFCTGTSMKVFFTLTAQCWACSQLGGVDLESGEPSRVLSKEVLSKELLWWPC